ncbi:MAG: rhomboid family intramembrane serine protease [Burkholderiales bacterium]|nr:rhomboid family intramembrane serine protease [Burkholderiales bacterium]
MHVHLPDPEHGTGAAPHFRRSVAVASVFVATLVLVWLVGLVPGVDLGRFGVIPREASGLWGILTAPMVHADFAHLASNALPLLIAGTLLLHLYPDSSRFVLPAAWLGPGLLVWAFGRGATHVGASGLVYGIVTYIFVAGILRRDRRAWAASVLVAFLYGTLVWGVLPIRVGVSWETHLAAAAIGVVLAVALRRRDVPPRKRYSWELEEEEGEPEQEAGSDPTY